MCMIQQVKIKDERADIASRRISSAQDELMEADRLVQSLPPEHQPTAREALGLIFRAGQTMGEMAHMPEHPVDPEVPMLGPEVREHIVRWRDLHAEAMAAEKLADKVTRGNLHRIMHAERQNDIAA